MTPAQSNGLSVSGLTVSYKMRSSFGRPRRTLDAVQGASFDIPLGQTLGIVGESGCGKSSLARALVRLTPISSGDVHWRGQNLTQLDNAAFRSVRPQIQMVFQDPFTALNPRMRMYDLVEEPIVTHFPQMSRRERRRRVLEAVEQVGLRADMIRRFPHEFSGGQAQRIGIARAIVSRPHLLICDEAVSALDVSVQALILALLKRLQVEMKLAMLFISHDLSVVRYVSHRIVVLYLGRIVETGTRDQLFARPLHPYTKALIGSVLSADPDVERGRALPSIGGDLPSAIDPPSGCVFRTRCPAATENCATEMPPLRSFTGGHRAACHYIEQDAAA